MRFEWYNYGIIIKNTTIILTVQNKFTLVFNGVKDDIIKSHASKKIDEQYFFGVGKGIILIVHKFFNIEFIQPNRIYSRKVLPSKRIDIKTHVVIYDMKTRQFDQNIRGNRKRASWVDQR